jgi:hypothetical protein
MRDPRRAALALSVFLPCVVVQLRAPLPRLDADAVEYYSHVRSLYFDRDVDFANEFEHFGILNRYDKIRPTVTGHRRTIFSVGPALLWLPFYAAGDVVARIRGDVEDGYSASHIRAVMLASLVYGTLGVLALHSVLLQLVPGRAAFFASLLVPYGTFLYWYVVHEPVMSHAASFFLSASVLRVFYREPPLSLGRHAALGLLIGLASSVRWQNAVLLLLPLSALAPDLRAGAARAAGRAAAVALTFALGALPQMLAWKAIFGSYLLADPPHGRDFLRLDHPFLLQTFFSSRHGLLYWTPVLWGGLLGYVGLARRRPRLALATLLPLLVMSYVNACSGDWWAGGSFSNRRFDSVLPFLALGLAVVLDGTTRALAQRPLRALAGAALAFALWNFLFMEQYRRNLIPRDDTVSFAAVAENNAAILQETVGSPVAWPANWLFAAREKLPVQKYDLMVGLYLFYRQNHLGGLVDLGEGRADPALLGEGWARPLPCGDASLCREVETRARLFAPLDVPETLDVRVRAAGRGTLSLAVNGHRVAEWPLGEALAELEARLPEVVLRRELNELVLETGGGAARVDRLAFTRVPRRAP